MPRFSLSTTQLIHENLSILLTFSFSHGPLVELRKKQFTGEWNYLDKSFFVIPAKHAEKACLELALFIRLLDDDEGVSNYLRRTKAPDFGRVIKEGQKEEKLFLRDLTNKIIHAQHLEWDFSDTADPKIICISREPSRWLRAEIRIISLAAFCGLLVA